MGRPVKDMTGMRFGHLTVLSFEEIHHSYSGSEGARWRCRCDCGEESVVLRKNLISGKTSSCGCGRRAWIRRYNTARRAAEA